MKLKQTNSHSTVDIVQTDPSNPESTLIRKAVDILRHDGVLVFPTSGLYGLGADAFSPRAVRRVFAIKQRSADRPVLVLLSEMHDIDRLTQRVPDYALPLLRLWPGGITLVFEAGESVPAVLTGGTGKIGVRMPLHPVAKALAVHFGGPITGTSANRSGRPAPASTAAFDPAILSQTDMVLDVGALAGGIGSTIVDVTRWPVKVLREGAVSRKIIDDVLSHG